MLQKALFSMNDSTNEPVTYERLQSIYIYASILMTKILAMMKTTLYANKTRLKPVLFSNIVHMILSVYALDEDEFKRSLKNSSNDDIDTDLDDKCTCIESDDIKQSSVKMFPMMIRHDTGWDESPDIKISKRDRFIWWWVDYLCTSFDVVKNHDHILSAIAPCAMFLKKEYTTFTEIDQLFFPGTVKNGSGKDIIVLDPLQCLSNETNFHFLSYIAMKDSQDTQKIVTKKITKVDHTKIEYEFQPLQVLLLCATHNFLTIPKKEFTTKVPTKPGHDPVPIIESFFNIIKQYSVQVLPEEGSDTTDLCIKLRELLKEQEKIPRMRTYKPKDTYEKIKKDLEGLKKEHGIHSKSMYKRKQNKIKEMLRQQQLRSKNDGGDGLQNTSSDDSGVGNDNESDPEEDDSSNQGDQNDVEGNDNYSDTEDVIKDGQNDGEGNGNDDEDVAVDEEKQKDIEGSEAKGQNNDEGNGNDDEDVAVDEEKQNDIEGNKTKVGYMKKRTRSMANVDNGTNKRSK